MIGNKRLFLSVKPLLWQSLLQELFKGLLGPLLFLIYINDLPHGLNFIVKLFADGTSFFSVVYDISASALKNLMRT